MIKYPVRAKFIQGYGTPLLDSDDKDIMENILLEDAETIANALNAMNDPERKKAIVVYKVDDEYGHKDFLKLFDCIEKAQIWFYTSAECYNYRSYGWILYLTPEQFNKENGSCGIVAEEIIIQ